MKLLCADHLSVSFFRVSESSLVGVKAAGANSPGRYVTLWQVKLRSSEVLRMNSSDILPFSH